MNNLNKSINYTSTITTNHESQDIGSNYGNIVERAAITGAIAAGTVWAGEVDWWGYVPTHKLSIMDDDTSTLIFMYTSVYYNQL